jgi:hypothetical protein
MVTAALAAVAAAWLGLTVGTALVEGEGHTDVFWVTIGILGPLAVCLAMAAIRLLKAGR